VQVVSSSLFAYQLCLPILAAAIENTPEFENRVLGLHLVGPFFFMQENRTSNDSSRGDSSSGRSSSDGSRSDLNGSSRSNNSIAHLEEILHLARGQVKLITVTIADTAHEEWPLFCSTAQKLGVATVLLEGQVMSAAGDAGATTAAAEVKSPAAKAMAALTAGAAIAAGVEAASEGTANTPVVAAVEADASKSRTAAAATMVAQLDNLAEDGVSGFSTLGIT